MQCYERHAMYLKLYADTVVVISRLEFDPDLLDEVLRDFEIDRFSTLTALDKRMRRDIIARIRSVIDIEAQPEGDHAEDLDCVEPEECSYGL